MFPTRIIIQYFSKWFMVHGSVSQEALYLFIYLFNVTEDEVSQSGALE